MKDFGIRMFNPQPEPPAGARDLQTNTNPAGPQTHYEYKLKDVIVTSYGIG